MVHSALVATLAMLRCTLNYHIMIMMVIIVNVIVIPSVKEVTFVCLSVCLLATLLKKFLTDFDEIFRIAGQ